MMLLNRCLSARRAHTNARTKCSCEVVISDSSVQSLQKASLAAETTGGQILVTLWLKHDLRSNLRVPNLEIFQGEHAPKPP